MHLVDKIYAAKLSLAHLNQQVSQAEALIHSLELDRKDCKHIWGAAYPNYEHEGLTCKLCGINDIHAHTLGYV